MRSVREYCECGQSESIANEVSQRVLRMWSVREYCECGPQVIVTTKPEKL
jgi:hypothetical protein